jgi:hypothetical protein
MKNALRKLFLHPVRQQKLNNIRHPLTDVRSERTGHFGPVARPHIGLKARMLGGQAKTIMQLGGTMR